MSPALRVALSIAVMRLPCSDAAFSWKARNSWTAMLRGSSAARIDRLVGLVFERRDGPLVAIVDSARVLAVLRRLAVRAVAGRNLDRDDLLVGRDLHQRRLELGVEQPCAMSNSPASKRCMMSFATSSASSNDTVFMWVWSTWWIDLVGEEALDDGAALLADQIEFHRLARRPEVRAPGARRRGRCSS